MRHLTRLVAVLLVSAALAACQPGAAEPAPEQPAAVRTALEATDPTTVTLGAGRPALVEFFAFW